jgi:hypothetical protein
MEEEKKSEANVKILRSNAYSKLSDEELDEIVRYEYVA